MKGIFKSYEYFIKNYPTFANAIQSAILLASGDLIAQTFVEQTPLKKVNFVRTAQFSSLGFFLVGPTMTAWYRILSKTFGDTSKTATLKKVACDQLLFAPCFTFTFVSALGVLEGYSCKDTIRRVKTVYFDIMINNYKLWPCVQLVNFYLVPLRYQVLLVQTVALFWNTYISWKTHRSRRKETVVEF